jgi:SAM-dependent methyltransferase
MAESLERRQRFLTRLASLGRYTFRSDEDVLDVGCGLGGSTIALARCSRRVIGIEATYSPQHGVRALRTYGLTNAAIYRYGLINRHLPAPAFPVQQAAFDVVFSYRGIGRFDLWDGAPTLRQLLKPGGCIIVLYPHFWYPVAPLDPLETQLWHYGARSSAEWETYTLEALQGSLYKLCLTPTCRRSMPPAMSWSWPAGWRGNWSYGRLCPLLGPGRSADIQRWMRSDLL